MISALVLSLLAPSIASAQLGDDDEFARGLLARYTADDRTVERVDAGLSHVWSAAAPDPRLAVGPFEADWSGTLLIRQQATYRIHAHLQGQVSVEIDGQSVLRGDRASAGWISGPEFELEFGEKPLEITFRKTGREASVRLFWSSSRFHLEPIPPFLLFHEDSPQEARLIETGRDAFEAHRCNACHRRGSDEFVLAAPALTHLQGAVDADWLTEQIVNPQRGTAHARMPSFGFSRDEARQIAALLTLQSQQAEVSAIPKSKEGDHRQGEILFRSIGCLACHQAGENGHTGTYGGGDLSQVGGKRSADWLFTWLEKPGKLNRDHRMPVFKLTTEERLQLAVYLSSLKPDDGSADGKTDDDADKLTDERLALAGRRLVEAARCAACHRIEGAVHDVDGLPNLSAPIENWSQSCLAERADQQTRRPAYGDDIDRKAIRAYVDAHAGSLSQLSPADRGARLLEQRNCHACHQRDQTGGLAEIAGTMSRIDEALRGQSEALIPPALTAVGDKLHDKYLSEAIRGEQKERRLDWLRVRMPRFDHTDDEQTALLAYFIGHDRIPADAPTHEVEPIPADDTDDAQTLVAGHTLIGAKGFSCIACHEIGDYKPRNVAPGTHGSDLLMLGERMRREFYIRWTRSPLRIVPGMEMPSYERAVPGVLGDDVEAQLAATWDALNDPRFTAPTNPGSVEQYWTVEANQPARVVRDVFTNSPENGGGYVPRSLAVGLHNGHNVLFDLDHFTVRQWRFGDLAQQRTQGKSWYWDMSGVPVVSDFDADCDLALRPHGADRAEPISPTSEHGRLGRVHGYAAYDLGLELTYELAFDIDNRRVKLQVNEKIVPSPLPGDSERTGWDRRIVVSGIPSGYDVLLSRSSWETSLGEPNIEPLEDVQPPKQSPEGFLRWSRGESARSVTIGLRYSSGLRPPAVPLKPKSVLKAAAEAVTSVPGFDGVRLPIDQSIMPTSIGWTSDGTLAFTSLKGHVYLAHDTDGDGLEDTLSVFEEGLAAPYGIIADGDDLIVSHKPELLRLRDTDGDGRADVREVVASGWGYTDNYHDWTCGIVRDAAGHLYVGLGSDYAQPKRPSDQARWRGKVLKIDRRGRVTPVAHALRYPTGLAIDAQNRIFISDNQGVQNTFNEINHLVPGRHYGVPSRYEEEPDALATPPAIQIPHPWSRSVNGLFFMGDTVPAPDFAGHGIGCEYDSRFLVRFTTQQIGDTLQGAVYYFSRPDAGTGSDNFLGPLCGGVGPDGSLYVGSIHDSGWLGGQNTGEIVRLRPGTTKPNGIRELRVATDRLGFEIEFFSEVDRRAAAKPESYSISGYTRVWKGSYATPDSGRHSLSIDAVAVSDDGKTVTLSVDRMLEGHVYEVTCERIGLDPESQLWPATGHYTLNRSAF